MDNHFLGINHVLEFLDNYKELAVEASYSELSLPFEGFLIYLEYYKRHSGEFAKELYWKAIKVI